MDVSDILDPLNDEQRAAVTSDSQHTLVLAGAGSGKTRVLIHRIAWLCQVENLRSSEIVAVTFTNKAAQEMKTRAEALLENVSLGATWIGTFHGLCHRLLRRHWQEAGLEQGFQVIDAQDQRRIVKQNIIALDLDESRWPAKKIQWFINAQKDSGARAAHIQTENDFSLQTMTRVYIAYEEFCQRSGLVDFAELILRTVELLRDNDDLRKHYHARFRAVLADEFQDTNALQYAWLQTLAGADTSVFAVGDDDQSIYGWRGARVENIQNFSKTFPAAATYRLERNYRSSSVILSAANALIENNSGRLGKKLWTDKEEGELIQFFGAVNEREEAQFIAMQIEQWSDSGAEYDEVAVLYRSNAQSRALEEALIARELPYRVYGGVRFFERAVIKDALAYLRLMQNHGDNQSFERIINMPPRGLGEKTLECIRDFAKARDLSLYDAGLELISAEQLGKRAHSALTEFYRLMEKIGDDEDSSAGKQTERVVILSGLTEYHGRGNDEKARSQVENLNELINAAAEFDTALFSEEAGLTPLDAFLAHSALEADAGAAKDGDEAPTYVQLMTLHSAKGLEFPYVVMAGMEENLFPHALSLEEPGRLEEERRLCYVGITRAQTALLMTYAETRRLYYDQQMHNTMSRFLREIPAELINDLGARPRTRLPSATDPASENVADENGITIGQRVRHNKFGEGTVLSKEGNGAAARVRVRFETAGTKWLVLTYANLSAL